MSLLFESNFWLRYLTRYQLVRRVLCDENGELDEKALLIGLFVIAAIVGLTTLATAVSGRFTNLAGRL